MRKEIIKPGTWWICRFRILDTYDRITGVLSIKNGYQAGHSGFARKWNWVASMGLKRKRRYRPRLWRISSFASYRIAYRFAKLSDARNTGKNQIKEMNAKDRYGRPGKWAGAFLEIVEVAGCLQSLTVESETVIERHFPAEINELEVLGVEFALGEL